MIRWLWPLVIVAATGLLASSAVNFLARRGIVTELGVWSTLLYIGCFLVAIPGFYFTGLHDKSKTLQQYWNLVRAVLLACPPWLRYTVGAMWVYGFYSMVSSLNVSIGSSSNDDSTNELIMVSGGLMMLYSMSLAMLYPSTKDRLRAQIDRVRNEGVGV